MSLADVEKFVKFMVQVPELVVKTGYRDVIAAPSYNKTVAFAAAAVREASELGIDFTEEDCKSWLNHKIASMEDQELSELELDEIAGGRVTATTTRTPSTFRPAARR